MTENNDEFFTPKHRRLRKISATANIFAWVVLVLFILQTVSEYLHFTSQQSLQSIVELFKEYPESIINFFLGIINISLKGVVYWLSLKGVSLGLNMIVEADLNYEKDRKVKAMSNDLRKQIRGNFTDSDNEHVFYKPKEVLWINLWLNRVAIASVVITILISIPEFDRMKRIILPYFMGIMEWGFVSLLIASVIAGFAIAIQCLIVYFSLKSLASILKILMEIEFNSRAIK